MMRLFSKSACMIAALCLAGLISTAQDERTKDFGRDPEYIQAFEKKNVAEAYIGLWRTRFDFTTPGSPQRDLSLVANGSAYIGLFVSYKWASIKYTTFPPGTTQQKGQKPSLTSLKFRFTTRNMMFQPFYNSYHGLLEPQGNIRGNFAPVNNVSLQDAGLNYYLFTNTDRYSFRSAMYFSEQQLQSAGGLLFMITPKWQQARWKVGLVDPLIHDSATVVLFSRNPSWFSVTGRVGYGYNLVFDDGRWMIAPSVMAGIGGLREVKKGARGIEPVTDFQATLNAGFNGEDYYFYASGWMNMQKSNLDVKDMHQKNSEFILTFGYRFGDLKNKILTIL